VNNESSDKSPTKGHFRRSVLVLVGGTAFGHIITALALPVATRLYSPADFSVLAVYASVVSIVSVAACLRFDIAVPVAGTDEEAANLLVLSLILALLVSLVVAITFAIIPESLLEQLGLAVITPYFWLLSLGILLAAAYSAFQGWFVRRSGFGLIARCRVGQSAAMAGGQIGLGAVGIAPVGLLVGHTLNTAVGCLVLGYRVFAKETRLLAAISRDSLHTTFNAFSRFPKYSTFEALCNSAAIQLPVIMIAALAVGPEAGYLILAMSVMQAPMALIGNAIGQVYLSRAPDEYRNGNLGQFTVDTLGGLSKVGIGPLIFCAIVAPDGFAIVFGESWRRAGEMVMWMTPWFITQLLSSPLSMAIHVTGHQRAAMSLQVFGLVIRVSAVWFASLWAKEFIVEAYALSGLAFYLGYLVTIFVVVGVSPSLVLRKLNLSMPFTFAWIVFGLALLFLMKNFVR
jgi:O-antigen/teichoic acid export membrane protein